MANLTLLQTRVPTKQAKKLDKLQKKAGVMARAEFLRGIINRFIEGEEAKEEQG